MWVRGGIGVELQVWELLYGIAVRGVDGRCERLCGGMRMVRMDLEAGDCEVVEEWKVAAALLLRREGRLSESLGIFVCELSW